jgi:hypothetical protein
MVRWPNLEPELLDEAPGAAAPRPATIVRPPDILLVLRILAPLALVACAYVFRRQIVDVLDSLIGLGFVFTVVHLYSTLGARLLLGCLALVLFALIGAASFRSVPQGARSAVFAGICAVLVAAFLWYTRSGRVGAVIGVAAGLLVGANAMSSKRWHALLSHPLANASFWAGVGVEALLPRPFLMWVRHVRTGRQATGERSAWLRIFHGAILAAAAVAAFAPYSMMMRLGQTMFMSPQAEFVFGPYYDDRSPYDVSDMARSAATGDIFLCGDTQISPKVLRGGAGAAVDTRVSNGGNEYCEFSGALNRFVTFDRESEQLLLIDPASFAVQGRLRLENMPYGEIFMSIHPRLNLIAVASEDEGGRGGGPDIRIVDLDRVEVVREIDSPMGYVITDPRRPVIYTNHFAMNAGLRAHDMRTGELLATSPAFGRSDRMTFDAKRDEILATSVEAGQIWRLDAATLRPRPPIDTVFGARGLAIDVPRDLLLVSSFLTNEVDVIDLKTGRSLRRYRLGPWLRDVLVVSDEGVAFVASRYGVYRLHYLR